MPKRRKDKHEPETLLGPPKVRDGQQVYTRLSASAAPSDLYHCNGCGAQVMQGPDTVTHDQFHARLDALERGLTSAAGKALDEMHARVDELDKDVERLGTGKATGKALDHLGRRLGRVETVVADLWHKQAFPSPLQQPRLNNEGSPSAPPVPESGVPTPVVQADDEKTQQSEPEDDRVDETVCDWGSKTDRPCRIPRWVRHTHGDNGYLQVFGSTYMGEVRNEPEPVNSPRVWQLTVKQLRDRLAHEQDNAVVILAEMDGSLYNLHASSQSGKATFKLLRVLDPTKSVEDPPPGDKQVAWTQAGYDAACHHLEVNRYVGHYIRPYDERGGFKCSCGVGVNATALGNWSEPKAEPAHQQVGEDCSCGRSLRNMTWLQHIASLLPRPAEEDDERVRLFRHLIEDHHISSAQQSHLIERDLEDLRVSHGVLANHSDLHRHCGWSTGPGIVNEPIVEASEAPAPAPSSTESDEQPSAGLRTLNQLFENGQGLRLDPHEFVGHRSTEENRRCSFDLFGWAIEFTGTHDGQPVLLNPKDVTLRFPDGFDLIAARELLQKLAQNEGVDATKEARKVLGRGWRQT